MSSFSEWFEGKFLEWQNARKKHSTIREFSDWLGLDQRLVANLMRGDRKPGPEYADIISIKFGCDMTVYDLIGLPRPDEDLLRTKKKLPKMTPTQRKKLKAILNEVEDDDEEAVPGLGRSD